MHDDFAEANVQEEQDTIKSGQENTPPPAEQDTKTEESGIKPETGKSGNTGASVISRTTAVLRRIFAKNSMPNLVLVLFLTTAITAAGLSAVYTVTSPIIERGKTDAFNEAMGMVFPDMTLTFAQSSIAENVYEGRDSGGNLVGFSVRVTVNGYGGVIDMIVGVDVLRTVTDVVIVSQRETRGFDAKGNMQQDFLAQFSGQSGPFAIGGQVDAISGATVTSLAVTQGINAALSALEGGQ